jgi:negative regulator of flagellin synthesis FlgM
MKITGVRPRHPDDAAPAAAAPRRPPQPPSRARPSNRRAAAGASALRALPDFDAARVAELRDALAKGELPFDAGRLAGLIQRFHGRPGEA